MSDVMMLIEKERKSRNISAEKFAHELGLTSTTYSRQTNGRQGLGLDALQAYARYARKVNNGEILRALGAYALCLNPEEITITVTS